MPLPEMGTENNSMPDSSQALTALGHLRQSEGDLSTAADNELRSY